ncbi:phosphopantetheine-binding protein [Pedobacter kyonggii]|uniref:Acyl carrier protein n=1 Tax=Pedobacter kyonggii TaxID=1926871 RepID=A0A4V2JH78_9SPHI|nr:phosphopantetheine-binding protein [Pedobacter kyonggii]TBO44291.1 acyl carrier protein [Pedobacter kyonggii]
MDKNIEELKSIIKRVIKKDIDIELTDPLDKIVLSSLTFVIIMGEIERSFDMEIPEDEMEPENFKDMESILNMINRVQQD